MIKRWQFFLFPCVCFLSLHVAAQTTENGRRFVYGINSGADTSVMMGGNLYQPDQFFNGGAASSTGDPISAISEDALFQSERYGSSNYEIPVVNSDYTVIVHLAELFHTSADMRAFSVIVEGKTVISNLDLYELVGHDTAFEYVVENVSVTDGSLSLSFETGLENAQVCGISVYSESGGRVLD